MVNYQLGKIYKIYSHIDPSICYVGSTCKKYLCQRINGHRSDYNKWKDGKSRKVMSYDIFEKFGVDNCIIELVKEYPCESKDQLSKKEGEYIKTLNCVNKCISGQTPKESNKIWREQHKELIVIKQKEYNEQNKEKIAIRSKQYREKNKEILLNQKKEYYIQNKEKIAMRDKSYRERNKDIIKERKRERQKLKKELLNK